MRTDLFDFELPADEHRAAARRARAIPRGCWWCSPTACCATAPSRDLPQWLRARRPARRQRHQGDCGAAQRPPHRPRDRAEDRGDADQAARRLALAGAGQARQEARARRRRPLRQRGQGLPARPSRCRRSRPRARKARSRCRSRSTARRSTRPSPISARRRCRPTSPRSARPTIAMPPTTRPCSRPMRARSPRRPRGCISRRRWRRRCAAAASTCIALTLHVGAGTFLPVKVDDTAEHKMHAEWGAISAETADALNAARAKGGRIVAVGTTSLRLLESAAARGRHHPAVRRRDVDLHHAGLSLPRGRYPADQFSSAALDAVHAGVGVLRARHHEAGLCARDREGYRFYSYGDACLLFRGQR